MAATYGTLYCASSTEQDILANILSERMPMPRCLVLNFAISFGVYCLRALAQTGEISGTVADQNGAVVPGAQVAVTETPTAARRALVTNGVGAHSAPALLPGPYTVAVSREDQQLRLNLALLVGSASEQIAVQSDAPVLNTESQAINDLPVDQISTASGSSNGARGNQNEYLVDGAPNTGGAQNQPVVYANRDSGQEVNVATSSVSAEFGRAAGGVFNVVTTSGTNAPHFTACEFLRNNALNANDWFVNLGGQKPAPLRFNQFGGVLGGPVVLPRLYDARNRTFVFVRTELVRFVQGVTYSGTVPSVLELSGDFSHTVNAAGKPIRGYVQPE